MRRTARYALLVIVLAGTALPRARAQADPQLSGVYASDGVNPDGSDYHGVVRIVPRGDSFVVQWMSPKGNDEVVVLVPTSIGVGIASDATLSVSYYSQGGAGIVVYRIEEGGQRLTGRWAVAGDDGAVYSETLTKLPGHEPGTAGPPTDQVPSERKPPRQLPGVLKL
jgi:hypothetical protein